MRLRLFSLLILLLLPAACSPAGSGNEANAPATPTPLATVEAQPTAADAATAGAVAYGRNEDGTFFHGAADAPVTLIDYSDFL